LMTCHTARVIHIGEVIDAQRTMSSALVHGIKMGISPQAHLSLMLRSQGAQSSGSSAHAFS